MDAGVAHASTLAVDMTNVIQLPSQTPVVDPMRLFTKNAFLRFRPMNKTADGTIKMLAMEVRRNPDEWPDGICPPDNVPVLRQWALEDGWEDAYRTQQVHDVLTSPELQPHTRLQRVVEQQQALVVALEVARTRIEASDASPADYKAHERLWTNVRQLDSEIDRLEEVVRRREFERTNGSPQDYWATRTDEIFQELQQQYVGYGQVYLILCRSAAEVRTKIEMMNQSGRNVDSAEFAGMYDLQTKTIAQLQKYTETMKSSVVGAEVQEAIKNLLRIIETEIGTEQPHVMQRIVTAVKQRLEGA